MFYVLISTAMVVELYACDASSQFHMDHQVKLVERIWTLIREYGLSDGTDNAGRMLLECPSREVRDQIETLIAEFNRRVIDNPNHEPVIGTKQERVSA
jgi:hypothetical protein